MILARFDRRDEIRMALPMKKVKGLSVVCRKQWWREQVKSCDVHRLAVSFWSCATFFGRVLTLYVHVCMTRCRNIVAARFAVEL